MANDLIPVTTDHDRQKEEVSKEFRGYSIEELIYQRALVALQKDFCRSKIIHDVDKIRRRGFLGKKESSVSGNMMRFGGIATKLISGLSYIDYAMLGMTLFSSGRKIFRFFKRRKK